MTKKQCWECINKWYTLKLYFEDKQIKTNKTLIFNFYTISYKIQYIITKLYFSIIKYAFINVVASPQMKELVEKRIHNKRILVRKITPIDGSQIKTSTEELNKKIIEIIENSDKIILFINDFFTL